MTLLSSLRRQVLSLSKSISAATKRMTMDGIEGLNSTHLAKGSAPPPKLENGKIRLYSMRFCPYVERVMIALELKKIPFEVVNINLENKPEWYLETNPLAKVPSIEYNGNIIYESLVCVDFLDDVFTSGKRISPTDPYERAKQRMLVERLSGLSSALYHWYQNPTDPKGQEKVITFLALYEKLLHGSYFAGENPGYVDYMTWPWVERLSAIEIMSEGQVAVTTEKYPKLASYIDRMRNRQEIKTFLLDGPILVKFIKSRLEGKVNYDIV